jgi:hypothetical protein
MYFGNYLDNVHIPAQSNDYYNNTDSGLSNPILFQITTPEASLDPPTMFFLAKYTRPVITKTYTEAYIQEVVAAIRDLEHLPANTTSEGMQCIDLGIRLRNINNSEVYI